MLLPAITSMSSAQADGQSCGQVEWRISTLACWFMCQEIALKIEIAEHLYPAKTVQKPCPLRVTLDNAPSKVRAHKISKTTPCKVAGGRHGCFASNLTRRANHGHSLSS